mmetsp:Transcript_31259/g.93291  ORF Transcript_31259/g.93291 Transcript_31259/m.93291 type:complete len:253 (-) Transcript_31259:455-1213(-)
MNLKAGMPAGCAGTRTQSGSGMTGSRTAHTHERPRQPQRPHIEAWALWARASRFLRGTPKRHSSRVQSRWKYCFYAAPQKALAQREGRQRHLPSLFSWDRLGRGWRIEYMELGCARVLQFYPNLFPSKFQAMWTTNWVGRSGRRMAARATHPTPRTRSCTRSAASTKGSRAGAAAPASGGLPRKRGNDLLLTALPSQGSSSMYAAWRTGAPPPLSTPPSSLAPGSISSPSPPAPAAQVPERQRRAAGGIFCS